MTGNIEIDEAGPGDLEAAIRLLEEATLPVADLDAGKIRDFLVARIDGSPAGFVGVELFGRHGLLRSLVVAPEHRDAGLGQRLVAAVESRAVAAGVEEMWLLTIDADRWFEIAGYVRCERSEAPAAIASTEEFAGLCPGTAILMKKNLAAW
jgi:N-acetylglutamate synthase-like GNAT family acetyltransferase